MNNSLIKISISAIALTCATFLWTTQIYAKQCDSGVTQKQCEQTNCRWSASESCCTCPENSVEPADQTGSFSSIANELNNTMGLNEEQASVEGVVNALLPYLLSGAGLILFAMLIMGGFDIMTAATDAKKAEAGKGRITAAIIGFVIIFAAYWIAQILEILFGVNIL